MFSVLTKEEGGEGEDHHTILVDQVDHKKENVAAYASSNGKKKRKCRRYVWLTAQSVSV